MDNLVGAKLAIISNKDIKYVGVLHAVNVESSTITLNSVRCLGTEDRRPGGITPTNQVYEAVVFQAQDIKDLQVLEQPPAERPEPSIYDDPAIINAVAQAPSPAPPSAPVSTAVQQRPYFDERKPALGQDRPRQPRYEEHARQPAAAPPPKPATWAGVASGVAASSAPAPRGSAQPASGPQRGGNFAARGGKPAMGGSLPMAGGIPAAYRGGARGGARGGRGGYGGPGHVHDGQDGVQRQPPPPSKPSGPVGMGAALKGMREIGGGYGPRPENPKAGEFDLAAGQVQLEAEKAKMIERQGAKETITDDGGVEVKPLLAQPAYNKSSSFFDSLTTGTGGLRHEEERRLNQETFGSAGIVHTGGMYGSHHRGGRGGYVSRGGQRGGYRGGARGGHRD